MLPIPYRVKPITGLGWSSNGRLPVARPAATRRPLEPGVLVKTNQAVAGPGEQEVFHAGGGDIRLASIGSCSDSRTL